MDTKTAHISRRCRPFIASAVLVPALLARLAAHTSAASSRASRRVRLPRLEPSPTARSSPLVRMAGQALQSPAPGPRVPERPEERQRRKEFPLRHRHLGSRRNRRLRGCRGAGLPQCTAATESRSEERADVRLLARRTGRPKPSGGSHSPTAGTCRTRREPCPSRRASPERIPEPAASRRDWPLRRPYSPDRQFGPVPSRRARTRRPEPHWSGGHRRRGLRHHSTRRARALVESAGYSRADSVERRSELSSRRSHTYRSRFPPRMAARETLRLHLRPGYSKEQPRRAGPLPLLSPTQPRRLEPPSRALSAEDRSHRHAREPRRRGGRDRPGRHVRQIHRGRVQG